MSSRLVSMGLYQYGIPLNSLSLLLSGNRIEVQGGNKASNILRLEGV